MSAFAVKNHPFMEDSLYIEPASSYLNMLQVDSTKEPKRSHLKVPSKLNRVCKSREKNLSHKSKSQNAASRSASRKKSKIYEKTPQKSKKTNKKSKQKIVANSKKQYKTTNIKPQEPKIKQKKLEKTLNSTKKLGLESVFKKSEQVIKKKKPKEELNVKVEKKTMIQKPKGMRQTRLKKSKSEGAMDKIPLSEIVKQPRFGAMESKVIHQYFGIQDKLSSIVHDKLKKDKNRLDKCKTRSSASSLSTKKTSKMNLKSGRTIK